jgi:hypothetical protein
MIKLIVNDVELDLGSSTTIALTKKAVDIGSLQNRWSSYTNKFNIPSTKKNRKALGVTQFQDDSGAQYEYQNGKLISGGLEIASNVLVIIESVKDTITLTLRAGNGTIFEKLSKTKLSDLPWSDLNHQWNANTIYANRKNTYTSGFVYPLMQTGNQSIGLYQIQANGLIPFVYVKAVFIRIANYFEYNWSGSTYLLDMFEKLCYPIAKNSISSLASIEYKFRYNVININYGSAPYNLYGLNYYTYYPIDNFQLIYDNTNKFTTSYLNTSFNPGPPAYPNPPFPPFAENISVFQPFTNGTYKFAIRLNVSYNISAGNLEFGLLVLNKKTKSRNWITPPQSISGSGTLVVDLKWDYTLPSPQNPNDYLIYPTFKRLGTINSLIINEIQFDLLEIKTEEILFDAPMDMNNVHPDITCAEFIKEVANIFGAIYDVDEFKKEIEIIRLDEIAFNKIYAYDWSNKLDFESDINVTYKLDGIGKTTKLSWNDELFFQKKLLVNNDQLKEEEFYLQSGTDYVLDEQTFGQYPVYAVKLWNGKKVVPDGRFRFALIRDGIDVNNYLIAHFGNASNSQHSLDYNELYDKYFKDLLDPMTERIQKVECSVKLNDLDIQKFRFKYPVYVKHFNRYFFIDEISEFTSNTESTKVILVGI